MWGTDKTSRVVPDQVERDSHFRKARHSSHGVMGIVDFTGCSVVRPLVASLVNTYDIVQYVTTV